MGGEVQGAPWVRWLKYVDIASILFPCRVAVTVMTCWFILCLIFKIAIRAGKKRRWRRGLPARGVDEFEAVINYTVQFGANVIAVMAMLSLVMMMFGLILLSLARHTGADALR
ncbi:hypothetical protein H8R18_00815 [Nanchangia anserum]|uniref:hypothetical protein n=1 Tax=Nanchangia anserum TaxID=2692125 RepID=UPI001883327A|nr:hypothetical protein [Nanchangia anserum]QOX81957.1 hypothetical protein H8R18_00815 [Nanchangia anserum]